MVNILTIDIRDNKSFLISFHIEDKKEVFQIITEDVKIILNKEQMQRLGYC